MHIVCPADNRLLKSDLIKKGTARQQKLKKKFNYSLLRVELEQTLQQSLDEPWFSFLQKKGNGSVV
jgi:hypothetical protein